ncbi:MAG: VanZ family protein [Bacteroidia bacterium]
MFLKHLWPALLCALVVLILCVIPGQDLPKVGIINFDKFVHSLMFGGLTFLFAKGFHKQTTYEFLKQHYLVIPFIFCTLYGGFLEILQATVCINRAGDWLDFLFDGIGALVAIGVLNFKKDFLLR